MLNLLKTHFGFDRFLPLQEEIIRGVLAQQGALVLMLTGGGKSRCFLWSHKRGGKARRRKTIGSRKPGVSGQWYQQTKVKPK